MKNGNQIAKKKSKRKNSMTLKEVKIGSIVCRKYILQREIGKGTFGKIYLGVNQETNEEYAIKIENVSADQRHDTLLKEAKILYDLKGERGVPRMYYFIKDDKLSIMVMSLLYKNLDELFKESKKKFLLKTVLLAADQMISRLEFLHSQGYIHRDIKPENFMVSLDKSQIFLIDFGLSKKYIDEKGAHIPYCERSGFVGTARYTSVYSHLGIEHSRRDDLESLGYVLVYFLKGVLPWMNLEGATKEEKHKKIADVKMKTSIIELCQGLPTEVTQYFQYVKDLTFAQEPCYLYLKKLFRTLLMTKLNVNNLKFEWEKDQQENKENGSTSTMLTDHNVKKQKNLGGRLKNTESSSNELKVIFKTGHSKTMRTTKDEEDFAGALNSGNEGGSFCTSSKSVRISDGKKDEENKKVEDLEIEKNMMGNPSPNINIISPPSSHNYILLPSKSLKISKQDMFNKLSTVSHSSQFRKIDGKYKVNLSLTKYFLRI